MKNKLRKTILTLLLISTAITGCNQASPKEDQKALLKDSMQNPITIQEPVKTAAATKSLADAWILAGGEIVAVTRDDKALLKENPQIVDIGSFQNINLEKLTQSDANFILLNPKAKSLLNIKDNLIQMGIQPAYYQVETFSEYKEMMKTLTTITKRKDLYKKNVEDTEEKIQAQLKRQDNTHPKILLIRAYSTGIKTQDSNTMTGHMLKDLGAINISDQNEKLSTNLSIEEIVNQDPDYIFVTTMGESKEKAVKMFENTLETSPSWKDLKAVKNNHVHILPKDLFHQKPNNNWDKSYEMLANYLYGEKQEKDEK